jgi:surface antigen
MVTLLGLPTPVFADGNHFYSGYCTWYAAEQAHAEWQVWLPWYGDAGDWADGARAAGWQVSAVPRPRTVVAMPRRLQGSGPFGHVAWVLEVGKDGSAVTVRSMGWQGLWTLTVHSLQVDGQITFIVPPEPATPSVPAFLAISS